MSPRFRVAVLGGADRFLERVTREVIRRAAAVRGPLRWERDDSTISAFVVAVHADSVPGPREAEQLRDELIAIVEGLAPSLTGRSHGLVMIRQPQSSPRTRERLVALLEDASRDISSHLRRTRGIDFVLNLLDLGPKDDGRPLATQVARWLTGPHPYSGSSIATSRWLAIDSTAPLAGAVR